MIISGEFKECKQIPEGVLLKAGSVQEMDLIKKPAYFNAFLLQSAFRADEKEFRGRHPYFQFSGNGERGNHMAERPPTRKHNSHIIIP